MERLRTNTVLIRYGEIGLKGKNRAVFENLLMDNLRSSISRDAVSDVRRARGRIFVDLAEGANTEAALDALARTFGVVSISPVKVVPLEDFEIEAAATNTMRETVDDLPTGTRPTFKVQARRANKDYERTSPEINSWLGAVILESVEDLSVDVHDPDIRLAVEIRSDAAYVSARVIPGPGGLPVGSSGRGLLLMSGGIDSPVAGWQLMKRGLSVEALHFHTPPFTGPRARRKVEELASILAPWGVGFTLHLCHFTEAAIALRENTPRRLHLTIMRRMMLRLASAVARTRDIPVLITGESLGQVASQTLENLVAIDDAASVPVFRPLIGADKQEIMQKARYIDTYETSIQPHEDCCSIFVPSDPKTTPALKAVREGEAQLPHQFLTDEPPEVETLHFGPDGSRIN